MTTHYLNSTPSSTLPQDDDVLMGRDGIGHNGTKPLPDDGRHSQPASSQLTSSNSSNRSKSQTLDAQHLLQQQQKIEQLGRRGERDSQRGGVGSVSVGEGEAAVRWSSPPVAPASSSTHVIQTRCISSTTTPTLPLSNSRRLSLVGESLVDTVGPLSDHLTRSDHPAPKRFRLALQPREAGHVDPSVNPPQVTPPRLLRLLSPKVVTTTEAVCTETLDNKGGKSSVVESSTSTSHTTAVTQREKDMIADLPPPVVKLTAVEAATPTITISTDAVGFQPPPLTTTAAAAPPLLTSPTSYHGGSGVRLRSLTPTPYIIGAQTTPSRRHRAVAVQLPIHPPKVEFSSIQRTAVNIYEIGEKLSEGTYGEVYKGVERSTGAPVALKRLKMLSSHQGFPQTSLREVIALRHIQNQRERLDASHSTPHADTDPLAEVSQLCDVLIFSHERRDIVLVFAYAHASLAGLFRRQFSFTPSELAYVMKKLVTAVRKLHEMCIIHRDIKSDNVLITDDGQVQLTDFGLCSIASSTRSWRTPSVITLAYRPPEMLLGSTAYDEKVDVWSIGCLLAQTYLYEPPFYRHRASNAGQTALQQQQHGRQGERTPMTELEQLSCITEILGPLPPTSVYHPDSCQHINELSRIEQQGRQAQEGKAPTPANWGKLQHIFQPSFLYQQFHGFRGWIEAELQRSRHQPRRRPSQACMDVLCATLHLDPHQRPSAADLLRMPYFQTLDDPPLLGSYQRLQPLTSEREDEVRRGFMVKVKRCGNSHTQRRPQPK